MSNKLKQISQSCHHFNHFVFSAAGIGLAAWIWSIKISLLAAAGLALIGAFLPDLDHLIFIFGYGRRTNYASRLRKFLLDLQFKQLTEFAASNHKLNYGIYSHNIAVPLALLVVFALVKSTHPKLSLLCISLAGHFVYDMLEDLLFLGKLNPNWWFKFSLPE